MKKIASVFLIAVSFAVMLFTSASADTVSAGTYYYDQLSENEKKAYDRMVNAAMNSNTRDVGLTDFDVYYDSFERASDAFIMDVGPIDININSCSFTYYIQNNLVSKFHIVYNGRSSDEQERFEQAAADVVLEAQKKRTDYDKLKFLHDWLVNHSNYVYSSDNIDAAFADGPVVRGIGNCNGYTRAFYYFARSLGFECICVYGTAGGGGHAWNMVKLDGEWYNVDVTWDDRGLQNDYKIYYNYFLKSDAVFNRDHTPDGGYVYPTAHKNYKKSLNPIPLLIAAGVAAVVAMILLWRKMKREDYY